MTSSDVVIHEFEFVYNFTLHESPLFSTFEIPFGCRLEFLWDIIVNAKTENFPDFKKLTENE